tara:strand:+ start:1679 stop:1906 length:228 start_codon:yes stop_codon:yes gene_type:complete
MQSLTLQQVKEKLKTLDDKTLSNMLKQRQDNTSNLTEAIKDEMATRCARKFILKEAAKSGLNKKHLDNRLQIIIG